MNIIGTGIDPLDQAARLVGAATRDYRKKLLASGICLSFKSFRLLPAVELTEESSGPQLRQPPKTSAKTIH